MSFVSLAFCTIVNACQGEICFTPLENHYRNQLRHKIRFLSRHLTTETAPLEIHIDRIMPVAYINQHLAVA